MLFSVTTLRSVADRWQQLELPLAITYDQLRLNYRTQCRKAKIIACSIVDREHSSRLCPAAGC